MGFSAAALWAQAGYGGPSVLSRPGGVSNLRSAPLAFRPYLTVGASYDTGLTGFTVNERGELPNEAAYGVLAGIGAYGYRSWKQTSAGLNYRGDFRHYTKQTYYDGSDHALSFDLRHQYSRRIQFGLMQSAGRFSRSFGNLAPITQIVPVSTGGLLQTPIHTPADELFDLPTSYFSTYGDVTYARTARLSFNAGGGSFVVRRRSAALVGVTGAVAMADAAYRLTRYSTVGVNYAFNRFSYTSAFGGADLHMVGLNYSYQLNRRWSIALQVSAIRMDTQAVRKVSVDPIVAAITGLTEGIEAFQAVNYIPGFGGSLSRKFRRGSLNVSYSRGVSPGNGLYMTSRREALGGSYSYTGLRRWNAGAHAEYTTQRGVTSQVFQKYRSWTAGGGLSRALGRQDFHLTIQVGVRRYMTDLIGYQNRLQHHATVGISYSPGDIPLSIW
jgi:hypothetical protein